MILALLSLGLALAAPPRHDGLRVEAAPAAWAAAILARATGLELIVVGGGATIDLSLPAGDAAEALHALAEAAGLVHQVVPAGEGELHLLHPPLPDAGVGGGRAPRGRQPTRDLVVVGVPLRQVRALLGRPPGEGGPQRVTVLLRETPPDLALAWLDRLVAAAEAPAEPPPPLACPARDPLALVPCLPLAELALVGMVTGPRAVALLAGPDGLVLAQDGDSLAAAEPLPDRLARWQLLLRDGRASLLLGSAQARTWEVGRRGPTLCTPQEQAHVACTLDGTGEGVALCKDADLWTFRVGSPREDRWSVTGLGAEGALRVEADGAIRVAGRLHQARLLPQADGTWRFEEAGGTAGTCRR